MRLYDYPLSEEFTKYIESLKKRIDELIDEAERVKKELTLESALHEIKHKELDIRFRKLEDDIEAIEAVQSGNIVIFREPFADDRSMDKDAVSQEPADINAASNMMTLKKTGSDELAVSAIRITSGNGLPGNLHTVYGETRMYHARDGLHISLRDIIDGNSDTWFEYERLRGVSGYKYRNIFFKEGIPWLHFDASSMNLELEVEFQSSGITSGIIVDPFIPAAPGYKPPYMTGIIIDDGKGMKQHTGSYQLADRLYVPSLPQMARRALVNIIQPSPYPVVIGIPENAFSISQLGLRYDPATGKIKQPEYKVGDSVAEESDIIEEYFVEPAAETLPALRYAIGLRQISFLSNTYVSESEYVSKLYAVPNGIRSIQLDVDYIVPEALLNDGLVRVYISFDDGATWHELAGNDRDAAVHDLPRKVAFYNYMPSFVRKPDTLYLTGGADTFRVKIVLKQPSNMEHREYITPVVTGYMAVIEEAGGDFSWV